MSGATLSLGACCICGGDYKVRNLVLLDRKSPSPGKGWGCLVCQLPNDGAVAVLCDHCFERFKVNKSNLRFACKGFPKTDGRVLFEELRGHHAHDMRFHPDVVEKRN